MADRIGVINKGELIVVEDKAVLMRKLGKKQLTLQLQSPLRRIPARTGRPAARALRRRPRARSTPSMRRATQTGIAALLRRLGEHGIDFKDLHSSESSLEDIFVSLREGAAMNIHGDPRDLPFRNGAHVPHADAEHRLAGAVDLAVFRRVRLGDRLAHGRKSTASATAPSSFPA